MTRTGIKLPQARKKLLSIVRNKEIEEPFKHELHQRNLGNLFTSVQDENDYKRCRRNVETVSSSHEKTANDRDGTWKPLLQLFKTLQTIEVL